VLRTDGYGYGWYVGRLQGEHPLVYHTGDNPGFRSVNAFFPRAAVRLVLLSNEETTDVGPLLGELAAAAFPGAERYA
jgi:hypothetical protein